MPALTGPAMVAAALLVLAGAMKVVDPAMTVGALRALGLPGSSLAVRVGAAAEVALGLTAVVVGGPVAWGLVTLSYLAFGAFVVAALRAGTMVGSCGCFGREDTPPHPVHVGLDLALAGVAGAVAIRGDASALVAVTDHPGEGAVVVALGALAVYLVHAGFVDMPRTLVRGRRT